MITITLPWPHKGLSPNARKHWRAKASLVKEARLEGALIVKNKSLSAGADYQGKLQATLLFSPPDNAYRDLDNMVASMKAYIDGVCDALAINDRQITKQVAEKSKKCAGGKVVLTLEKYIT